MLGKLLVLKNIYWLEKMLRFQPLLIIVYKNAYVESKYKWYDDRYRHTQLTMLYVYLQSNFCNAATER